MTYTIKGETTINASKSRVWEILANLETVEDYDSAIVKSFYLSDQREGVGASRQCDLPDGSYVREGVVDWRDGEGYTLTVDEDGTEYPVSDQKIEFSLEETDEGTRVVMSYKYSLKPENTTDPEEMAQGAQELVNSVLAGLKGFMETGEPVAAQVQ